MANIHKLPLLMALTGAIITGLVGYTHRVNNKENMTNMVITMIIFYVVGLLIRNTITSIMETLKKKAEERENEEKQRIAEEKKNAKEAELDNNLGQSLNLVADDKYDLGISDDEFDELPVADYIKNELRK